MNKYISLKNAIASGCPALAGTIDYLKNFLGAPHPNLEKVGHKGTICPFTAKVLENEAVTFAREAVDINDLAAEEKVEHSLIKNYLPNFLNVIEQSVEEKNRKFACLIVIVHGPNTPDECNKFVSLRQKNVQQEFVQAGLLLSELHPHSPVPSVRNSEFFPSRPPFPIFFIRRLIPNDIPYLLRRDRYNDLIYLKILNSLKRDFGMEVIEREMKRLGKILEIPKLCLFPNCSCPVESNGLVGFGLLSFEQTIYKCKEDGGLKFDFN